VVEVRQHFRVSSGHMIVPYVAMNGNRYVEVLRYHCNRRKAALVDSYLPLCSYASGCGPTTPDTSTTPATISAAPSSFGQVTGSLKMAIEAMAAIRG